MAIIGLWWVATHGKGTAPGRLVAWGVMLVVVWGFIAASNASTATTIAGDGAHGLVTAIRGFTDFARDLLGG